MKNFDEIKITGIDWQTAFCNMPDKDELQKLVQNFYRSSEKDIQELETTRENLELYRIKSHSMKNALAIIGAMELSDKAKELEFAARESNYEIIAEKHSDFVEEYRKLAKEICIQMTGDTEELIKSREVLSNHELSAKLDVLEKAMEAFDMNMLNEISFELEDSKFESDIITKCVRKLIVSIVEFDIEAFEKVCIELRNVL